MWKVKNHISYLTNHNIKYSCIIKTQQSDADFLIIGALTVNAQPPPVLIWVEIGDCSIKMP